MTVPVKSKVNTDAEAAVLPNARTAAYMSVGVANRANQDGWRVVPYFGVLALISVGILSLFGYLCLATAPWREFNVRDVTTG